MINKNGCHSLALVARQNLAQATKISPDHAAKNVVKKNVHARALTPQYLNGASGLKVA